jgi:hypothetical protein
VRRFLEFFAATIRNPNTRRAYARACSHRPTPCATRDRALIATLTYGFACIGAAFNQALLDVPCGFVPLVTPGRPCARTATSAR